MKKLGGTLTYANVVSTICLFLLLGGGAAFAASKLAKNSVGSKQLKAKAVTSAKLKNGAVTAAKLANGAVTNPKLADGAVDGNKVADSSLTGADISQSTLTSVKASNVYGLALRGDDEFCTPATPFPTGFTAKDGSEGFCTVTAPFSLENCAITATVSFRGVGNNFIFLPGDRSIQAIQYASSPNSVTVELGYKETRDDLPFSMTIVC